MATNELRAHISVTGDQQAKRAIGNVGDAADRAGDQLEGMGHDAGFLKKQIADTETQYKAFIRELDATGDVDILKKIRKERRQLRLFEGLQAELEKELQQTAHHLATSDGTSSIGLALAEGIGRGLEKAPAPVIAGLAVIVAEVLPFLGAAVAGSVLGAAGAGGIVGGFVLAAQDQRVRDAAKHLGQEAKAAFQDLGDEFAAPAIESLRILQAAARDVAEELSSALDPIKPLMPALTAGLTGFVEEFLPRFAQGLKEAQPAIRVLSSELPKIGAAIGDFFDILGDESDGATLGFIELSHVLQGVIRGTAQVLAGLSAAYEWSVRTGTKVTDTVADLFGWVPVMGDLFRGTADHGQALLEQLDAAKDSSHDFTDELAHMGSIAGNTAAQLDAMRGALDDLFGNVMDAREATRAYEEAIDRLSQSVAENGRTLDVRIKQGRENQAALDAEAQAIKRIRDANIDNGMALSDANAIYDQQLEGLRRQAYQLGLNKAQVNAFIDALKNLPTRAEVEVSAPGLLAAIAAAKELTRLLGSRSAAANAAAGGTYVSGRAGGGPVMAGQTYVVGENGPEVLKMGAGGGYVYSPNGSGPSAAMMSGASGGTAQPVVNLSLAPGGGSDLESAIVRWLATYLRVNGGSIGQFRIPRE